MDEMKKKLRQAFDRLPAHTPDQERKEHNIRRATEEFSRQREEYEKNRQGFSLLSRLTVKLRLLNPFGGENMQLNRKLIGGLAVAMLAVVVGTSIYQNTLNRAVAPVSPPVAAPPQPAKPVVVQEARKDQVAQPNENSVAQKPAEPAPQVAAGRGRDKGKAEPAAPPSQEMLDSAAMIAEVEEIEAVGAAAPAPAEEPEFKAEFAQRRAAEQMATARMARSKQAKSIMALEAPAPYYQDEGRDQFEKFDTATVHQVATDPVSTFSADVDTASYAFVRRQLNSGLLPQRNAVRVEEMINYFDYDYPASTNASKPFQPTVAVYPTPWNPKTKLVHIGVKGYVLPQTRKPAANLVFLVDVSGSMDSPDKLPLAKNALRMLVDTMNENDTVGLVVYAGAAGVVLEPTPVKEKGKILAALDNRSAGGSTAGGEGIRMAYALDERSFKK